MNTVKGTLQLLPTTALPTPLPLQRVPATPEQSLAAIVERLEALVKSVDKLREALVSMKPSP